jgi:hypothetical protein
MEYIILALFVDMHVETVDESVPENVVRSLIRVFAPIIMRSTPYSSPVRNLASVCGTSNFWEEFEYHYLSMSS